MAIEQITLNRFDLGIAKEERDLPNGYFRYLENVEVGDEFRSIKQTPNTTTTNNSRNIKKLIEFGTSVYGLGTDADPDATIYKLTAGGTTTPTWGTITNGTATGYNPQSFSNPFFAAYGTTIYYASAGYIGSYVGTTNTPNVVVAANIQGGVVHRSLIYGWIGQEVNAFDPSDDSLTGMITIPDDQTIVDLVPDGDNLVIVCTAATPGHASLAYFWDTVDTEVFLDIKRIGYGEVTGASNLDGRLLAVIGFKNRRGIRIKVLTGGTFKTETTYFGLKNDGLDFKFARPVSRAKAFTNYLYFLGNISRPGQTSTDYQNLVLFRYGKTDETKLNALSVYKVLMENDATGFSTATDFMISESYYLGTDEDQPDKTIVAVAAQGSDAEEIVTDLVTSESVLSAQAGLIETCKYTGGNSFIDKKWISVATQCEALTSGQSIVLKYRINEEADYTTFATINTVDAISQETLNIEGSDISLPDWKELQIRIELLGGAKLTGLQIKYEEQASKII